MNKMPKDFRALFLLISISAVSVLVFMGIGISWDKDSFMQLLVFGSLVVASESLPVALPKGGFVTVSYAIFMSALITLPSGVAFMVAASAGLFVVGKAASDQPLWKRIFNASQFILSMFAAWGVKEFSGITGFEFTLNAFLPYALTSLAYVLTNVTIVSMALGKLLHKSPWRIWSGNLREFIPNFLALVPLGLLMSMIYKQYGAFALILLFVPLLMARHSFQLYIAMRKNYLNTVEALVQALEAKDSYTSGHSGRVAQLSVKLAEELNFSEDRVEYIKYAGVLHDVGKIGVSETVLNKQGRLTEAEWEMIRNHPTVGQNIIQSIDFLFDVGQVVRHHHERIDGKGYPDGLKGEDIPLESRIIAIADTYDAMTSDRSYRQGKSVNDALIELERVAGTQLDAKLVETFCKLVRRDLGLGEKPRTAEFVLT